jgi:ATP-dependent RNA helicase DeaD
MTKIPFSQLSLTPKVERAIGEMGFDLATPIQSEAIPLIRTGVDVIARSQTGTGKTIAFAIPAIEKVDTHEEKATIQVLILCPTRELAQQATEVFRKLAKFKTGIHPVEIYGGASIEMQCIHLRRANIVIGTPGRVMDHMRRKTIELTNLKMIVLDEADEMLNMGFKEDIETILKDTPDDRQTFLFAATMPEAILALTKEFQKGPKLIEIDKNQITIKNIEQSYIEVPHDRKKDALGMLLQFHQPNRAIIFCNTKLMVDELTALLRHMHFSAESIHSDIKQTQRTSVMQGFKQGKTSILIATDIAARGIDVSDVDFVINFDIPANTEYYIHRIGRTGRAGKSGRSITICGGRREVAAMRRIAFEVKSEINQIELPSLGDIQKVNSAKVIIGVEEALKGTLQPIFMEMADQLVQKGYSLQSIAAAALQMRFANQITPALGAPIKPREPEVTIRA